MQVAQRIGGYSLGQADLLRRAMGKKKHEVMVKEKEKFIEGAVKNGFKAADADRIFEILIPFAGYGFNKSHAAAYSVVAYRTAYLKANYPAEFMAANLTNEIANTDKLTEYIGEARTMGLEVLPPDVNRSEAHFSVVDGKIVYGFLGIKGVGEGVSRARSSPSARRRGPYLLLHRLRRAPGHARSMNKKTLECLASAGCFDSLGNTRRELVLEIERAVEYAQAKEAAGATARRASSRARARRSTRPSPWPRPRSIPAPSILRIEKELLGFYFSGHPMDEWAKIRERCSDADLAHPERASPDKTYTVIAMLKEFREIFTKSGQEDGLRRPRGPRGLDRDRGLRRTPSRSWRGQVRRRLRALPQGQDRPDARRAEPQGRGMRRSRLAAGRSPGRRCTCRLGSAAAARGGALPPARRPRRGAGLLQRLSSTCR